MSKQFVYAALIATLPALHGMAGTDDELDDELDDERPRPGLAGHYLPGANARDAAGDAAGNDAGAPKPPATAGGQGFQRLDRTLSFHWTDGVDPRLPPGRFQVRWKGRLKTLSPGDYRLAALVHGDVQVVCDGEVVLAGGGRRKWLVSQPLPMEFGYHPLRIHFRSDAAGDGKITLFWEGPQFEREPIGPQWLFHDAEDQVDEAGERGAELVRALRCAACHEIGGQAPRMHAPALKQLGGRIHRSWLLEHLSRPAPVKTPGAAGDAEKTDDAGKAGDAEDTLLRRMPYFQLDARQAEQLTAYLLADASEKTLPQPPAATPADIEAGEQRLAATGCLACHRVRGLGTAGPFGGGDLSAIADKRPPGFFAAWLESPAALNEHHRMPKFDLPAETRRQMAAFLQTLKTSESPPGGRAAPAERPRRARPASGRQLFVQHRCDRCHAGPDPAPAGGGEPRTRLRAGVDWQDSCLQHPTAQRPGYQLNESDAGAVASYIEAIVATGESRRVAGAQLMEEANCLACHARNGHEGLAPQLSEVARAHPELASRLPALQPPSLTSVGDKLFAPALRETISRRSPVRRDWLDVRMPQFPLSDDELDAIVEHLTLSDQIEGDPAAAPAPRDPLELLTAGRRLVTADGFGCTSCHAVGKTKPPHGPLNARGPDLALLGQRIRREWFDRWVRNPARIVPRMEMPSVQIPVRGVLHEDLGQQLDAVWQVLNRPGFVPPEPNPVRIARRSGLRERGERAIVATDVLRTGGGEAGGSESSETIYIKPLLIGLPNRHNLLYDLESGALRGWWPGDLARQRTRGKTWFWTPGGIDLLGAEGPEGAEGAEWTLDGDGPPRQPAATGQFVTEIDTLQHLGEGLEFTHRINFRDPAASLKVTQTWRPEWPAAGAAGGVRRDIEVRNIDARNKDARNKDPRNIDEGDKDKNKDKDRDRDSFDAARAVALRVARAGGGIQLTPDRRTLALSDAARIVSQTPFELRGDAYVVRAAPREGGGATFSLRYELATPVDTFPVTAPAIDPPPSVALHVAPGFAGARLPLAAAMMPTGLAWDRSGALLVSSLKGQVWRIEDRDGDGLPEDARPICDDLAAPFGLHADSDGDGEYIDVIGKWGLVRLRDPDRTGWATHWRRLASGWGHTADYHDWAVGLPRDEQGGYYIGTACQQDSRSPAAAHWRGAVLRLRPDADGEFQVEPLSEGHRFPIGMARSRQGQLFVTDNQGNYNPFNELNHVLPGKHYGFINAIDRAKLKADPPPLTPPAVNIPHPWTRSVNGICFLETPAALAADGRRIFGPYEGHLVGCEYDTRRLIRLSLDEVGGQLQGAAYPFTVYEPVDGQRLLGPLCCAVSPAGDLMIGSIRDSGWGGANNIGSLARFRPQLDELPAGIAEVRAAPQGLLVQLAGPIDASQAARAENYSVSSYRRIVTPAYGGPDADRRKEKIVAADWQPERKTVLLRLPELRAGFVYEVFVKNAAANGAPMFPSEAHYSMNQTPQ